MSKFEILCATMHQTDFSKILKMNIRSDVLFANQADRTAMEELNFDGHHARMITTNTRGVGINRNIALLYAMGDICLFADDDVTYDDDMEQRILAEFASHPKADIIIFHLASDSQRGGNEYKRTRKCHFFERMPWGAYRMAVRLTSVQKANIWFTTLFGGGCIFPAGEDSMWFREAIRKGLSIYVSRETIGRVSFAESTWFTGYNEKYFFGQGAFYQATRPWTFGVWMCYSIFRTRGMGSLTVREKIHWIRAGKAGYRKLCGYNAKTG